MVQKRTIGRIPALIARTSFQHAGGNDARTTGQILHNAHISQSRLATQLSRRIARLLKELADKKTALAKHIGSSIKKAAENIQAVASAVKCQVRLKIGHLVRKLVHHLRGIVGRVRNQYVKRPPFALAIKRGNQIS